MVKIYLKFLMLSALLFFTNLNAQVAISADPEFRPHPGYAIHIDGNVKVDSGIKFTDSYGAPGQILKSQGPDQKPIWVDNPDMELPEGMLFIENTYIKLQQNGAENVINNRITEIPTISFNEIYTDTNRNGWQKIVEINDIVVSEPKSFLNFDFQTGATLSKSNIKSGNYVQFACGVFVKRQNETNAYLKGYRLGQITSFGSSEVKHTNFDMIYTIALDETTAIGTYDSFVACKKFNEFPRIIGTLENYQLNIGSSGNTSLVSLFSNQSVFKVDVAFKL